MNESTIVLSLIGREMISLWLVLMMELRIGVVYHLLIPVYHSLYFTCLVMVGYLVLENYMSGIISSLVNTVV